MHNVSMSYHSGGSLGFVRTSKVPGLWMWEECREECINSKYVSHLNVCFLHFGACTEQDKRKQWVLAMIPTAPSWSQDFPKPHRDKGELENPAYFIVHCFMSFSRATRDFSSVTFWSSRMMIWPYSNNSYFDVISPITLGWWQGLLCQWHW